MTASHVKPSPSEMTASVVEPVATLPPGCDGQRRKATDDIVGGLAHWQLWSLLGWQDIRQRYRRSLIGPFWLTLSMGIMVTALGVLYASLFKIEIGSYLPYLAAGLIVWGFLSTLVTEGCTTFFGAEGIIKQVALPLSVHAYRLFWRNFIIFLHNLAVMVVVVPAFGVPVGASLLLLVPALILYWANALWMGLLLGMLCARFRDVPQIIGSLIQITFFMTPILWHPTLLKDRAMFVDANPLYHFVDILRAPLLGEVPGLLSWQVVGVITLLGWAVTFWLYVRYRRLIAYWL